MSWLKFSPLTTKIPLAKQVDRPTSFVALREMRKLIESMGAKRMTHFDFVFGIRSMFLVVYSYWVFLFKFMGSFFRFPMKEYQEDLGSNCCEFNEKHSNDHFVDQGNRGGESSTMATSTTSSKYEFLYRKSTGGFIEEPTTKSLTLHELYMVSIDSSNFNGGILDSWDSAGADVGNIEKTNVVCEDETEECALRFSFQKSFDFEEHIKEEDPVEQAEEDIKDVREETEQSVDNFIAEIETEGILEEIAQDSVESCVTEKILERKTSGEFFESTVIDKYLEKWHQEKVVHENHERSTRISCEKAAIFEGSINPEETRSKEDDKETEFMVFSEKTIGQNRQVDEDSEHDDDLIERLKMEVKLARTGGLATILEDFESPKMVVEPLQIDEKYDHIDHIAQIQKVHKSYSDKMRKLDILNSQTMHAISLLQLKDVPILPRKPAKSSAPAIKSIHKALSFRQRKTDAEPAIKLIRDLHKEFETVYVGQICLSWAILHWQFRQVKKFLECNTLSVHQYNQAAGEFQHFQVLLQRFLEDEPFRTRSRVENYVNYRCSVRHLLQVPVIKDDCSKYKEDAVSSEMLKDIIEESMHVFWEFLRIDKDEPNSTSKAPFHSPVAPHDPIDFDLLIDVRTDLQKKEKRLKEIQRGTNCIIKKFHRQQHYGNLLDHALFIAHVELKLVSRVINMSKINTDQLVWCHEKLQKIKFSSRKIEIEPSFTLFPC